MNNKNKHLSVESCIRIMAGGLVLLGIALALGVNHWWLALPVFVGVNLIQSAFSGFCPAEMVFKRLGFEQISNSCSK